TRRDGGVRAAARAAHPQCRRLDRRRETREPPRVPPHTRRRQIDSLWFLQQGCPRRAAGKHPNATVPPAPAHNVRRLEPRLVARRFSVRQATLECTHSETKRHALPCRKPLELAY